MYNNLIEEDIMILDNKFFKIDTMFEYVDKMYDIKMKELEYNYIYTESINEEYIDLYTEAEEAKSKNEQGLLGRLFTAILNFIRKIRAKILRFFGNDKKASELEAKIKGNPKLANQTVEITNTTDAEKAIDEGTSFFGSLIDKIVKGTATEADADDAEEKNKSLLSRIGIFAGGALLAAGGAKVASDKLKERGVTKQTIKETVSNLLKREEDTQKKSNKVTQTNEQNVQKAQQAMNNNSQSGNEENTKAGRRIVGSFKDFITDAGKFFTGKASEIRSKINGVSSGDKDGKGSSKSSDNKFDFMDKDIEKNDVQMLRNRIGNIIYTSRDFSSGDFDAAIKYVESKGIKLKEPYNSKYELVLNKKDLSECTREDFAAAVFNLKENFCTERINEVKKIGKYMYGPGGKAKNNDESKENEKVKEKTVKITDKDKESVFEKYERQQKSSKTTSESSYDLINDIKTIFENSFNKGERNMDNTKVLNFIDELEQERRNAVDNNRFKDSISYKYNCLNNAKKDGVEECLSKSFEKFYLDAIPLNDEYKTANHDDLCNDVHDFIKKNGAKSMTYYVGEARKKSPVMKKLYESVEKLVDDKFKEKEEKINETKPELDLVFKMDGETEKKIDVINQDLELDDIAKVISDNVRNTAMSEINRAKEEKENMKQIETDLANDINVKSEAAIERELSLRGINQKAVFQPSLFEGIMIGKMNKLSYTTESTDDVYLYNAMKDYTGAFYEGGESATPEEIAFVESVRELTLLSMERALKIKKYSLQDIKNLANEYASMK